MKNPPQPKPGNRPDPSSMSWSCPFPIIDYPRVLLAHGGGGKLMHRLIDSVFLSAFNGDSTEAAHDAALIDFESGQLAFTTDSFVIRPLFFSGGNMGSLAVYGTLNDLAMSGATPLGLSAGFIIEEGFPVAKLIEIVHAMRDAALSQGVRIVTGDTKVVERGKADGIYINTSGIGRVKSLYPIRPRAIELGDAILINGDIGRHGMAVMAEREGLEFEMEVQSDATSLVPVVSALIEGGIAIHCMRDLTRGGLSSALNELAVSSGLGFEIDESKVAVEPAVAAACELLGLDVHQVACEGRFIAFIPAEQVQASLNIISEFFPGAGVIGSVKEPLTTESVAVVLRTRLGVRRILDMAEGEQLPRIC